MKRNPYYLSGINHSVLVPFVTTGGSIFECVGHYRFSVCIVLFLNFVLCLPDSVFPQSVDAVSLPQAPYISHLSAEENKSEWPYVSRQRLWVRMAIDNPALASFILRVTFRNGGKLYSWYNMKGGEPYIRLRDLELRYRNSSEMTLQKRFADAVSHNEYVYEIPFTPEDAQLFYNMELWAYLNTTEARAATPGIYEDTWLFEIIEVKHAPEALRRTTAADSVSALQKSRQRRKR